jgi:hypothetical protein
LQLPLQLVQQLGQLSQQSAPQQPSGQQPLAQHDWLHDAALVFAAADKGRLANDNDATVINDKKTNFNM